MKHHKKTHFPKLALCLWGVCQTTAAAVEAPGHVDARARSVVDMAGRTVVLPKEVKRVATVGSVPVINGYRRFSDYELSDEDIRSTLAGGADDGRPAGWTGAGGNARR